MGGGTGGIGVAAMLCNEGMKNIVIIEPNIFFFYQPLWTLVGGGLKKDKDSRKFIENVIPRGVLLLKQQVVSFQPDQNTICTADGSIISYDYLVVACGIQIDWKKIPGLKECLDDKKSGVVSIYDYEYYKNARDEFNSITKGRIIFTMPNIPIKCAGAAQKIMWLTDEMLRDRYIRGQFSIEYYNYGSSMFSVKKYSDILDVERRKRDVKVFFEHELVSIDGSSKTALFKSLRNNTTSTQSFDILHVTPPMSAPNFIKISPLSDPDGWLNVDKFTLQNPKYPNVFGIGDCCNTPNIKTAAAVMSQAPVLVHNLINHSVGKPVDGLYNGYSSCPLIIGKNKVVLAEFGYDGQIMETFDHHTGVFPWNLLGQHGYLQQHLFAWMVKHMFPFIYWNMWIRGRWYN